MRKFHEVKEFVWRSLNTKEAELGPGHSLSLSLTGGYSLYENPTQAVLAEYLPLDPICHVRIKLDPPILHLRLEVLSNSVDQRREGFPQGEECTEGLPSKRIRKKPTDEQSQRQFISML